MKDQLNDVLFGKDAPPLLNIKFSRGPKEASQKEFRDAAAVLIMEIDSGLTASKDRFGDADRHRVDPTEVVKRFA
ncbi:MAG: hypothetical protein AAFY10_08955 [Pseudomonadota bacterium]